MRWSKNAKEVLTKFAASPRMTSSGVAVPSKKSVASKVAKLTKKVDKLAKVSTERVDTFQGVTGLSMQTQFNTYNISRLYTVAGGAQTTTPIFGTNQADLADVGKAYLNSKDVYISLRQNNEPNMIRYSMFIVSLKDQGTTTSVFDPATRQLVALTSGGVHYVYNAADQVVLNPKTFTIHATRRFTMGYEGSIGPTSDTYSEKRFKFTLKPRQKLITNATGNVFADATQTSPLDPSQNYFILIFNDNSSSDLENNKMDYTIIDHWEIPS
ncbi:MAG: coat protein [Cressdnaviricota sp.]|nr:MAG: coat protein [Cressdnaviricota sp.]